MNAKFLSLVFAIVGEKREPAEVEAQFNLIVEKHGDFLRKTIAHLCPKAIFLAEQAFKAARESEDCKLEAQALERIGNALAIACPAGCRACGYSSFQNEARPASETDPGLKGADGRARASHPE